jgi:hypothetical protein
MADRPLLLVGDARTRGFAQGALAGEAGPIVRQEVRGRMGALAGVLGRCEVRRFLAEQRAATGDLMPEMLAEIDGLAAGFAIDAADLFTVLHAGAIADLVRAVVLPPDGCTAFAVRTAPGPAIVAKNRDYAAAHLDLQRVFLHRDPDPAVRDVLTVGSLGSPGVFSSGVNDAGLALADTAVATDDIGPGLHRYFLMTLLLQRCTTVAEALAAIARLPHTGGGSLVLGDRTGAVAAVDLGHRLRRVDAPAEGAVARTNHHPGTGAAPPGDDAAAANSAARLATAVAAAGTLTGSATIEAAAAILARHRDTVGPALCRHGQDDGALTISGAVYDTSDASLLFAAGAPCGGGWVRCDHGDPG